MKSPTKFKTGRGLEPTEGADGAGGGGGPPPTLLDLVGGCVRVEMNIMETKSNNGYVRTPCYLDTT